MKYFLLLIQFSVMSVLLSQEEMGNSKISTAVLDIQVGGVLQFKTRELTESIRTEVVETGKATTVEAARILEVLSEMGLSEATCSTYDCALEVGQTLEVSYVMLGTVNRLDIRNNGKEMTLDVTFRLIDVQEGNIARSVNRIYYYYPSEPKGLQASFGRMVWELMSATPPPDRFPKERRNLAKDSKYWLRDNSTQSILGIVLIISLYALALKWTAPAPIGDPPDFPN